MAAALPALVTGIAEDVRSIPPDRLRRRSAPEVWSPIEYLGHLREAMAFQRWLIEKAIAQDNPVIPSVDPDASVAEAGYLEADVEELVGQFDRRVQRLRELLRALDGDAEQRTLVLDDVSIPVALVARSAWHECHHHHGDIRRLG